MKSSGSSAVLSFISDMAGKDQKSLLEVTAPFAVAGIFAAGLAWEAGKNLAVSSVFSEGIVGSMYHAASVVGGYSAGAVAGAAALGVSYFLGKELLIRACSKLDGYINREGSVKPNNENHESKTSVDPMSDDSKMNHSFNGVSDHVKIGEASAGDMDQPFENTDKGSSFKFKP